MESQIPSVSDLTNAIKILLEESIGLVSVKGEISNFKGHSSGHRYFILKDENSQISCTLWRGRLINFLPKDGMKVIVTGELTVYPPRGQYQIECTAMQPLGIGDLYLAYEALKAKLESAGYFAPEKKLPIPELPLKIGVITSPTGAAIKDIFSTIERRFPLAEIYFRPALVQGEGSSEDITSAIKQFQKYPVDVLIVGRGGGSIEDLWSFNTEIVADAIYNSKIPVISAVGHETDFTIADFVADLRAATPTAAAELSTPLTIGMINDLLFSAQSQLQKSMNFRMNNYYDMLKPLTGKYITRQLEDKIKIFKQQTDEYEFRINQNIKNHLKSLKQKVTMLEYHCRSVNPLNPLKKGFALLQSEGKNIPVNVTLGNFINIEIVRENEKAIASINSIIPTKRAEK